MFRHTTQDDLETAAAVGTRQLFALGEFRFIDTLDDDGMIHQFVLESVEPGETPDVYRTDRETMYEMMARFLSGEQEKRDSGSDESITHGTLLEVLGIARTWARSGKTDFAFIDLDDFEMEFEVDAGEVLGTAARDEQ